MGKAIIKVSAADGATWFAHGFTIFDVKELLKLPASYAVEDVKTNDLDGALHITVVSEDIPEVAEGLPLPDLVAKLDACEGHAEGKWEHIESYRLTQLMVHLPLKVE